MIRPTRKRAKPVKPSNKAERNYRGQLYKLVRAMHKDVDRYVMPVVRQEKSSYTRDGDDDWASLITAALADVSARYVSQAMQAQYNRMALTAVAATEVEATAALAKSIRDAVGVDLTPLWGQDSMRQYIQAMAKQNSSLIRSIPERYFSDVETAVIQGTLEGHSPSRIAKNVQEATGVSARKAKMIARDQTSRMTGQIVEKRQQDAGIKYYRSSDSNDERVTGNPNGKYPNAKISCWGIARKDIGYGPGVYTWKDGATWGGQSGLHPGRHHILCRCDALPVFDWEIDKLKK